MKINNNKIIPILMILIILITTLTISITVFAGNCKFTDDIIVIEQNKQVNVLVKCDSYIASKTSYCKTKNDNISITSVKTINKLFFEHYMLLTIVGNVTGDSSIIIYNKNKKQEDECDIKVIKRASFIKAECNDKALFVGEQTKCNVKFYPDNSTNKELKWISSDQTIATVNSNSMITGINPGRAIIMASTIDGLILHTSIEIYVNRPISSITFKNKEISLTIGDTYKLLPIINPDDAIYENLIFESSDKNVIKIENNKVKAINLGKAEVTCSVKSDKIKTTKIIIKVVNEKTTKRQDAIIEIAENSDGTGVPNTCQKWIKDIYNKAFNANSYSVYSALEGMRKWTVDKLPNDLTKIPKGATIYSDIEPYGHVGYYDGNGYVLHNQSGIKAKTPIKEFVDYYNATSWGWQNGDNLSDNPIYNID